MLNAMELNGVHQASVNDDGDDFPEHLHQTNYTSLVFALGDEDSGIPWVLHHQIPCRKRQLDDLHKNIPPGGVGILLHPCCLK